MSVRWKLIRENLDKKQYQLSNGECTIGRSLESTISLPSTVVSRQHCAIHVNGNKVTIVDLKSSNGTYVNNEKIDCGTRIELEESAIIGIGWSICQIDIPENDKFIFKLVKEDIEHSPLHDNSTCNSSDIFIKKYSNESSCDAKRISMIANYHEKSKDTKTSMELKPIIKQEKCDKRNGYSEQNKSVVKIENGRLQFHNDNNISITNEVKEYKFETFKSEKVKQNEEKKLKRPSCANIEQEEAVIASKRQRVSEVSIDLVSDSDDDVSFEPNISTNVKCEAKHDEKSEHHSASIPIKDDISVYDNVKQELDNEAITIDSDDSCDADLWLSRLSQSQCSGLYDDKPINENKMRPDENEVFFSDIIILPLKSELEQTETLTSPCAANSTDPKAAPKTSEHLGSSESRNCKDNTLRRTKLIDVIAHSTKPICKEPKPKSPKRINKRSAESKKRTPSKNEERKKKLREIAIKNKPDSTEPTLPIVCPNTHPNKQKVSAKITTTSRGAFLTENSESKPSRKIKNRKTHVATAVETGRNETDSKATRNTKITTSSRDAYLTEKSESTPSSEIKKKEKHVTTSVETVRNETDSKAARNAKITTTSSGTFLTEKSESNPCIKIKKREAHVAISIESIRNETDSKATRNAKETTTTKVANSREKSESNLSSKITNGKACAATSIKAVGNETDSKAGPIKSSNKTNNDIIKKDNESTNKESANHIYPDTKPVSLDTSNQKKKTVRFSTAEPKIIEFQIEPGNRLIKPNYEYNVDRGRHSSSITSIDRQYIMKILKWNTNWLNEKKLINNNHLPDLMGVNIIPSHIFHNFSNHAEYVKQIGHLLLIDLWDTLATECNKTTDKENMMEFRIESVSTLNKHIDSPVTICVNLSLPKRFIKDVPKQRDLMILNLRPGVSKFFYVHEITPLPAPPNNVNSFYSIQLHTTHSEKLVNLQRGEAVHGERLINISSYIILFQAIQCLTTSPLCEIVLQPQPHHFVFTDVNQRYEEISKWTNSLNVSQLRAVDTIVTAALNDKPSINMVQGPPGTGKSSVICSIVMQFFYGNGDSKIKNRGKILICATSNAAVDGLVSRLLNIRQTLSKGERFRMVRVGRDEVMHENARTISLKTLAERSATPRVDGSAPLNDDIAKELNYLQTKENMWISTLTTTEDPARRAYCQSRLEPITRRKQQLAAASAAGCAQRSFTTCEQQVIEKADIIATTLTSVANNKMQWLKELVTLCIVDEAGQAIEPVALIPLTLGVTRLALIGDPQQLPGFTHSEVAKEYGLGESLFSRLSSCGLTWPDGGPTMLLNVQYRMHPEIADYPNRAFYDSKIQHQYSPRCDLNLPPYKVLFITGSESEHGSAQTVNDKEAWAVSRLATSLYYMLQPKKLSLAVITPYLAQKDMIKSKLRITMDVDNPPVEVNTVDSFQGQERDVVVVSLTRRRGVGFLYDAGRMNVMLTRAKHSLLICIDPKALQDNNQWKTLIDDAKKRKLYRYLPEQLCKSTTPQKAQTEDVLRYLRR